MPGTAKEYGVKDPHDVQQAARGAARYLAALGSEFHNNWGQAIAAYNWGEGNVENAIKKHGDKWLEHAPSETQNYVKKVLGGMNG